MRGHWRACILGVAALGIFGSGAGAQSPEIRGVELWAGYAGWSGEDFETFESGVRGGATVLAHTAPHVTFGLEGVVGGYGLEGSDETLLELGANFLARLAVGPQAGYRAYVQGRVGWSRLRTSLEGIDLTTDGLVLGPEVGVEVPFSAGHVLLAASGSWHNYGSTSAGAGTVIFPDSGGSGFQYGLRAGVVLGL